MALFHTVLVVFIVKISRFECYPIELTPLDGDNSHPIVME